MILRDFTLENRHTNFGGNWKTNKEETEGLPPSLYITKIPQLE